jgi:proline dehydrogenase
VLRAILLYLSKAPWARRIVTGWRFARRAASRFVAGDTLDEAIDAIRALNSKGLYGTIDYLGENVSTPEEAHAAADYYLRVLDRLHESGVQSSVSVKLSQMGLGFDFELCLGNMRALMRRAAKDGLFVRLDMEDAPTVNGTFAIYRALRKDGYENVGLVVQAYLYRSENDVATLLEEGAPWRLCKGAYKEPPEIAYPKKKDVNAAFDRLTMMMLDYAVAHGSREASGDGKVPPITAVATHDVKRIDYARSYAASLGLSKRALEFQMLHGIRSDLQLALAAEGYPVRIYVPHGAEWYPYFMRRLAERPANLWFFLSNLFRG